MGMLKRINAGLWRTVGAKGSIRYALVRVLAQNRDDCHIDSRRVKLRYAELGKAPLCDVNVLRVDHDRLPVHRPSRCNTFIKRGIILSLY